MTRLSACEGETAVAHVEQGTLAGSRYPTHSVFYAVPYAAPPIGEHRFGPPRPVPGWLGTRDASRPGSTAPQPARGTFGALDLTPYFAPGWVRGQDYLTLNVWAPADQNGPAPVLVFLHGGAYVAGSSYSPLIDGRRFAEDGVVTVTVNYRLGVPGFLDLPGAHPNRGLADVWAALAWVQANISAFNGDPDRVTLGGQSAGATLTAAAVAAQSERRLFCRAIVESGSGTGAFTPEQAGIVRLRVAETLGVKPTLCGFDRVEDEALIAAAQSAVGTDLGTPTARDPLQRITPLGPVLDEQPATTIARGEALPIDLLVGHNAEEGNLYTVPNGLTEMTSHRDLVAAAAYASDDPARLLARYETLRPGASAGAIRGVILGEAAFGVGTRELADSSARAGNPTFAYVFTWRSAALNGRLGAAHVVETPFAFDNLVPALSGEDKLLGPLPPPQDLADRTHRAWIDFVTHGSPGWSRYDTQHRPTMRIGDTWELVDDPFRAERPAWATPSSPPRP